MTAPPIGPRLAALRRRRGLSQVAVAGLVGRSESWLSQVERGLREVDNLTVLRELARVLRIDLDDLVGVGTAPRVGARTLDDQVERAERALFEVASPPEVDVARTVHTAHTDYQAARYDAVLDVLPRLLPALPTRTDPGTSAAGWTVAARPSASSAHTARHSSPPTGDGQ